VSLLRWGYCPQSSALETVGILRPPTAIQLQPCPSADQGGVRRLANEPAGAPRDAATAAAPCTARAGSARPAAADCAASTPRAASASGDCAPSGATSAASLGELLANRLKVFSVENEERSEVDVGDFLIIQIDLRTQHVIGRRRLRCRPNDPRGIGATRQRHGRTNCSHNRRNDCWPFSAILFHPCHVGSPMSPLLNSYSDSRERARRRCLLPVWQPNSGMAPSRTLGSSREPQKFAGKSDLHQRFPFESIAWPRLMSHYLSPPNSGWP
jgi:hypothetical protein